MAFFMNALKSDIGKQVTHAALHQAGQHFGISEQQINYFENFRPQPVQEQHAPHDTVNPNHQLREALKTQGTPGNRKSLLIGINYRGHNPGELKGCINDVQIMKHFLDTKGFPSNNQRILTEDDPNNLPTKSNIEASMRWLVEGVAAGDDLFFQYSGHGTQVKDDNGEEKDGKDEALVPLDYQTKGVIRDDFLYEVLVKHLPQGVRLTVILDCCHSGSALDLPYTFKGDEAHVNADAPSMLVNGNFDFMMLAQIASQFMGTQQGEIIKQLLKLFRAGYNPPISHAPEAAQQQINGQKLQMADVIMISGCMDNQTSADVGNTKMFGLPQDCGPGGAGGACTNAFLSTLHRRGESITWLELLDEMRKDLQSKGFQQVPQLSSTQVIELNTKFDLFN